ncbi:MAG: NusG domain II-containing protein [Ruminiclostridium sp.]|nr:NusG domain II-containing protein [Ruminiclostridium sp.]
MNKKTQLKIIYIITALIFLGGIAGSLILMQKPSSTVVEIVRDEQVLYRFDLNTAEDRTFTIEYNNSHNTVEIKNGEIRVSEANCKDNTCVKTGVLKSGTPIVCLPNHLVIRFAKSGEIDAAAG